MTTTDLTTKVPSPPVLSDGEEARTVQLSATYGERRGERTTFTLARFHCLGYTLLQRTSTDPSQSPLIFELSDTEMDALAATWQARKADLAAKALAEQERRDALILEAYEVARACGGIFIVPQMDDDELNVIQWEITGPGTHQCQVWADELDSPDQLLRTVRELVKRVQEELARLAARERAFAEAATLAEAHGIRILPGADEAGCVFKWDIVQGKTVVATVWERNGDPAHRLLRDVQLLVERQQEQQTETK